MSQNHWEIKPSIGLGLLQFGLEHLKIKEFDHVYGKVIHTHVHGNDAENFNEYLAPFADFFSDEMLSLGLEDAKSKDAENAGLVEETRNPKCYLRMDFWHGHLSAITVDQKCRSLFFNELYLFDLEPRVALRALHDLNGGALVKEFDVVFDKLGIILFNFHFQSLSAGWRYIQRDDKDIKDRFVTIFDPGKKEKYFDNSFIRVDFSTR
jgi:hypothetical protein